jgi:hypothetical protein
VLELKFLQELLPPAEPGTLRAVHRVIRAHEQLIGRFAVTTYGKTGAGSHVDPIVSDEDGSPYTLGQAPPRDGKLAGGADATARASRNIAETVPGIE